MKFLNKFDYNKLIKAIMASALVGIAAAVYSILRNPIGAILFAVAIFVIVEFDLSLYTAEAPKMFVDSNIKKLKSWADLGTTYLGNLLGAIIVSLFFLVMNNNIAPALGELALLKISQNPVGVFFSAILCELMIYIAANTKGSTTKATFIRLGAIAIFVLCGFEHSIANMTIFICGGALFFKGLLLIALATIGNFVGAFVAKLVFEKNKKEERNEDN